MNIGSSVILQIAPIRTEIIEVVVKPCAVIKANICKALGIKLNIAMLYLADEMFKNRHKTFTVTFGKPIPWQTFDKSKTPAQWAEYVKDIVYKL